MITYRFATSPDDFEAVRKLVMHTYGRSNYVPENRIGDRLAISDYTNRPGSATIIACVGDVICGTLSVVIDSPCGIPADSTYKPEVDILRELPGTLVEICQFAADTTFIPTDLRPPETVIAMGLFSHMVHLCQHEGIRHLCFVVNPKHTNFYVSCGGKIIGPKRNYEAANLVTVELIYLDLTTHYFQSDTLPKLIHGLLKEKPDSYFFEQIALTKLRVTEQDSTHS